MEIINFQLLTISEIALLGALLLVFLIQMYYLLRYYLKLALHKDTPQASLQEKVTIILPVRNEENRIREILARFDHLDPDNYQVLVINEFSEDNTLNILNVLAETNPRLKVTSLSQETRFSEKQALNIGLKGADSPWVTLLTPYSRIAGDDWLSQLSAIISPETEAVIGYTNFDRTKGFRNWICRLERFNQFLISGAWSLIGKPFVFNENNILFKKSMYFDTLGFRHKLNLNFANLELIFNENFKKGKVKLSTNPAATVREHVEDDRGDHIRMLKKGVQIRQSLSFGQKTSLFIDDLTRILLMALTIVSSILLHEYWITILLLPFIYLVLLAIIVKMLIKRLNERKIFLSSLAYILIKPLINWWLFWSMYLIHRRSRWN